MSRDNTSYERGFTWYGGTAIDTGNLQGGHVLGQTKVFEAINESDRGVKTKRLNGPLLVARLVRNNSGITLYPKRLVKLSPTDPNSVVGLATSLAEECYPVDEYAPSTGVPNGDIFWLIVRGPAMCLTPMDGDAFGTASIAAGDILCSLTTTGGTTQSGTTSKGGRVSGFSIVAATTVAQHTNNLNFCNNQFGRALSAVTSGQTNSDILVDVGRGKMYA